jgi:sugar phosphate isomerase/epimerase
VRYAGFLSDGWWRHRLPGWGQLNWVALYQRLWAGDFAGTTDIEHEDALFGHRLDEQHKLVDAEEYKRSLVLSLGYLKHARKLDDKQT